MVLRCIAWSVVLPLVNLTALSPAQTACPGVHVRIPGTQGRCDFLNIEPGTYALAVIHDENMDGRIDTDWLGFPTGGYGFSAEAKDSMSPPSFDDASFPWDWI